MKKYNRLSAGERLTIHEMRASGRKVSEISRIVGRPKGTVSKELSRHEQGRTLTWTRLSGSERARIAEERAKSNAKRRGAKRKLENPVLKEFVLKGLCDEHWSPEAIEHRSRMEGLPVTACAKTIYTWIKRDRTECLPFLRRRGKPRRQRVGHRRGKFRQGAPAKRRASERPKEALERLEIGHFEVDTVVSCKNGKGGVLALRERVTRQRQYAIIPDLKAATVLPVLRAMLLAWPEAYRKSLTFDNGSEFCTSEMSKLEGFFPGLSIYYTDAYAAWQKGAVENSNEELRWYFPKGTDFAKVSPHHLRNEIARLNRKPMKCNGWKSSQELFDKLAA